MFSIIHNICTQKKQLKLIKNLKIFVSIYLDHTVQTNIQYKMCKSELEKKMAIPLIL